ncbi:hypothetical protein J3R30DRAFT_3403429 [Lentinula aciculospora]|uniref:Uncharacterized protein n=1 Tax=Lentinula aciculospora TaxID=153920 RepID=A0A9W9AEV3_9AGAR|nr:hypothetical protein J3R30DRAFT_3403429 [Lentinula aciculospora]
MNSQRRTSSTDIDNPYYASNIIGNGSNTQLGEAGGDQIQIWQLPYFPPLNLDDEFEVLDLELVYDSERKEKDILVRARSHTLTRPMYKIQKQTHGHFIVGKKNLDILISRLESWDPIHSKPILSHSSKTGKGYIVLFQSIDQNPRHISLVPTKSMVLYSTARGGNICLTPYCGSYDPQRSRASQPRTGLGYHYLPLHTTDFEQPLTVPGQHRSKSIPVALTKPYSGGGYLLFDAHSRGHSGLLSTLYCTGYERRDTARIGDIVLAELRLSRPGTENAVNVPSWGRLFRERHASLFISKRGIEAVFTGLHVNMFVPKSVERHRYTLTSGQAREIIISLFATSLLAIEHQGIDSKKWAWLLNRTPLESESVDNGNAMHSLTRGSAPRTQIKYSPSTGRAEREFHDTDSASFTDVDHRHRANAPPDFDKCKVVTYHNSNGHNNVSTEVRHGRNAGIRGVEANERSIPTAL